MFIEVCKSKLHKVNITEANLQYMGSISIDEDLMDFEEAKTFKPRLVFPNIHSNRIV